MGGGQGRQGLGHHVALKCSMELVMFQKADFVASARLENMETLSSQCSFVSNKIEAIMKLWLMLKHKDGLSLYLL